MTDRSRRKLNIICMLTLLPAILLIASSCGGSRRYGESVESGFPETIRLSDQFGLAYAPVTAARMQGWFDEELPETVIEWVTMGNATAIREAILARRLDGGFMGIPPYLIGRDRGMKWTAVAAVSEADLGLATVREGIGGLADIPDNMRIALPQPGSIQHILLTMAAQRELGDAAAFDNQLVTLNHPDGMNALLSNTEIDAHFTSPPYLQKELESGAHLILDGDEAFGGDFTFIIAVMSDEFITTYPNAVESIRRAIDRGSRWLNENPREASGLLAGQYSMDESEFMSYLTSGALSFGGEIRGMERFREFMDDRGYLKGNLNDEELILP